MDGLRSAISKFSIRGKRRSSTKRKIEDMAGYEPVPTTEGPPRRRTREVGRRETDPTASCRRSVFNLWGTTSPSKHRRVDVEMTAESVVDHQKTIRDVQREEQKESLREEKRLVQEKIAHMNEKIDRRRAKLESLRIKNDAEKWEDDLYETRMKELKNARTVIHTQSTVTGEGVRDQIKDLNQEIALVAAAASETQIGKPVAQEDSWERIAVLLGNDTTVVLQSFVGRFDDQRFVRGILQMFITRAIVLVINSWCLEKPNLNDLLSRTYSRIRSKEEQTVAGKWRQITFEQLLRGQKTEVVAKYADVMIRQLMDLSSHVGWGGDTPKVQKLVQHLMQLVENIRINVRGGIISADLQPWIADCGVRFDDMGMKDASREFGLEFRHPERCVVFGSIELGLKAHQDRSGDDQSSELKGSKSRPRVLLVELRADSRAEPWRAHRSTRL